MASLWMIRRENRVKRIRGAMVRRYRRAMLMEGRKSHSAMARISPTRLQRKSRLRDCCKMKQPQMAT